MSGRGRDRLYCIIGSALGLGLSPVAPGSFGALLGVLYYVGFELFLPALAWPWAVAAGLLAVVVANHWLTPWAVAYWKSEDPRHFVLDEVAGYLVVPLLVPQGTLWQVGVAGFLLFRILDVIKVPPARQVDRKMHGPWGILLDDLISGAYAAGLLHLYRWVV